MAGGNGRQPLRGCMLTDQRAAVMALCGRQCIFSNDLVNVTDEEGQATVKVQSCGRVHHGPEVVFRFPVSLEALGICSSSNPVFARALLPL